MGVNEDENDDSEEEDIGLLSSQFSTLSSGGPQSQSINQDMLQDLEEMITEENDDLEEMGAGASGSDHVGPFEVTDEAHPGIDWGQGVAGDRGGIHLVGRGDDLHSGGVGGLLGQREPPNNGPDSGRDGRPIVGDGGNPGRGGGGHPGGGGGGNPGGGPPGAGAIGGGQFGPLPAQVLLPIHDNLRTGNRGQDRHGADLLACRTALNNVPYFTMRETRWVLLNGPPTAPPQTPYQGIPHLHLYLNHTLLPSLIPPEKFKSYFGVDSQVHISGLIEFNLHLCDSLHF